MVKKLQTSQKAQQKALKAANDELAELQHASAPPMDLVRRADRYFFIDVMT